MEVNSSGAWQGGTGEEQFLFAETNYTRNTSLPPWTDESAMYGRFMIAKWAWAAFEASGHDLQPNVTI